MCIINKAQTGMAGLLQRTLHIGHSRVMMVFSIRALYNSLLEHMSFKQANLNVQLAAL